MSSSSSLPHTCPFLWNPYNLWHQVFEASTAEGKEKYTQWWIDEGYKGSNLIITRNISWSTWATRIEFWVAPAEIKSSNSTHCERIYKFNISTTRLFEKPGDAKSMLYLQQCTPHYTWKTFHHTWDKHPCWSRFHPAKDMSNKKVLCHSCIEEWMTLILHKWNCWIPFR